MYRGRRADGQSDQAARQQVFPAGCLPDPPQRPAAAGVQRPAWYTVGGRIRQGETSAEAARRECLEETGCPLEPEGPVFVQERFYGVDGCGHHEVVFFYRMKGETGSIPSECGTDQPGESLRWVPVHQLGEIDLRPPFLKDGLQKLPDGVMHVISRD